MDFLPLLNATDLIGERHPIAALDASGSEGFDPVRRQVLQAFARRLERHQGRTRDALTQHLTEKVQAYLQDFERHAQAQSDRVLAPAAPRDGSPISGLLSRLSQRQLSLDAPGAPMADPSTGDPASPEDRRIRDIDYFRSTWSRLQSEQRVMEARATLPENAGPLNSHQLVHRALSAMHLASPAYLERFVAHVDALLWMERQASAPPARGSEVSLAKRPDKKTRKPARKPRSG